MLKRAAFLDRDGVLNVKAPGDGYITSWDDMVFIPGTTAALRLLNKAGFIVIVVTNQRCIARRIVDLETVAQLHERMLAHFSRAGAKIDGIFYCPHEVDANCFCRKPMPGMLLAASRAHRVDLTSSWMIGDSSSDVDAGKNAGCRTIHLTYGSSALPRADLHCNCLSDAVERLLETEGHYRSTAGPTGDRNSVKSAHPFVSARLTGKRISQNRFTHDNH